MDHVCDAWTDNIYLKKVLQKNLKYCIYIYGVIAQLVERYNGIVEVKGSTPFGSTISCVNNCIFGFPAYVTVITKFSAIED